MDFDNAYIKCLELAHSHYENFPVARMMPKKLRKHVAAVYAFARTSDDIADENHEDIDAQSSIRTKNLELFEHQLDIMDGNVENLDKRWNWIFIALNATSKEFNIPIQLYRDLVSAFKQDVVQKRYETFADVLDYCRRSANPVGRLVLLLHQIKSKKLFDMSDNICTALQLANFWQDISRDWKKNRIYVPKEDWQRFGVNEEDFFKDKADNNMRECIKFQCQRTAQLFDMGQDLPKFLPFPLSLEIRLTLAGGRGILKKTAKQHYDTLAKRPSFNFLDKVKILFSSLF